MVMRTCPNCGKDHQAATFCPYCNAKVPQPQETMEKLGSKVKKSDIDIAISQFFLKNEKLLAAFSGWGGAASILNQYLIISDARVIFWERGLLESGNRAFYYNDISDVSETRGVMWGGIELNVHGGFESFPNMNSSEIPLAVKIIRDRVNKVRNESSASSISIPDQIKKLAELRDSGILTEQEFTSKKTELLKRL